VAFDRVSDEAEDWSTDNEEEEDDDDDGHIEAEENNDENDGEEHTGENDDEVLSIKAQFGNVSDVETISSISSDEQADPWDAVHKTIKITVNNLLIKMRTLSSLFRRSNLVYEYFLNRARERNIVFHNLIIDFRVRWNTTFFMIVRFLHFKDIIIEITNQPQRIEGLSKKIVDKISHCFLSQTEWLQIESLKKILEPFVIATKIFSGRKYPTLSVSISVRNMLQSFLEKIEGSDFVIGAKEILLASLNHHLNKKIKSNQKQAELVKLNDNNFL
jgi:hypothetical protein